MQQAEICFCQEDNKKDDPTYKSECGHTFHKNCIIEWLKRSETCPMCRKEIKENVELPGYTRKQIFFVGMIEITIEDIGESQYGAWYYNSNT